MPSREEEVAAETCHARARAPGRVGEEDREGNHVRVCVGVRCWDDDVQIHTRPSVRVQVRAYGVLDDDARDAWHILCPLGAYQIPIQSQNQTQNQNQNQTRIQNQTPSHTRSGYQVRTSPLRRQVDRARARARVRDRDHANVRTQGDVQIHVHARASRA